LGVGARSLHERWVAGRDGVEDGVGRATEFVPEDFVTRKEARRTERFTQLAIAACEEAIEEAGWREALPYEADRIGCVIGTGVGGLATIEDQHDVLHERGEKAVSPFGVPMMMTNAAAGALAMRHGLTGPNWGVVSACASGAHAIGTAVRLVQCGEVDAIVTGGAESCVTPLTVASFAKMSATSRLGISRPFDARRDGFVMGEGAGVLVLEDAELAEQRGATILGEVLGYGATSDAFHLTAPQPGGAGAARAITAALREAGVAPSDVTYVNAHGTSTPLNDRAETDAIKTALGEHAHEVPVSALKSAIGHLLGAGGAVEAVATVLALRDRIAPPTINYEEPEDGLDLDYVPGAARPLPDREAVPRAVAISNSFGFGGHNAVLCLADA
jgi:3-oxoacyl-[acyl-carrier-protein] synthase II